jgi:hypothetical protein
MIQGTFNPGDLDFSLVCNCLQQQKEVTVSNLFKILILRKVMLPKLFPLQYFVPMTHDNISRLEIMEHMLTLESRNEVCPRMALSGLR